MRKRLVRLWAGTLAAVLMLPGIAAFDAKAEKLAFTRSGEVLTNGGDIYWPNSMGGAKAYIPINLSARTKNRQAVAHAMLNLPGMQTGQGTLANQAAFRYTGFSAYEGSGSQYLVKYAMAKTTAYGGTRWILPSIDVGDSKRITFRYAGMVINGDDKSGKDRVPVIAGTNPFFPADTVSTSSSAGAADQPTVYYSNTSKDGSKVWEGKTETAYGTAGGVYQLSNIYTNGMYNTSFKQAVGNVKTNKASLINGDETLAKMAFEAWLNSTDGYGQAYKDMAEDWIKQNNSSMQWWQVLNMFFQINGNPNDPNQSLYFYMINGKQTGGTRYCTYTIVGEIAKNTSPTLFAIKNNETGEILAESYRPADSTTSTDGSTSDVMGPTVKLIPGEHYTVEGIMTFYSLNGGSSSASRGIQFYTIGSSDKEDPVYLDSAVMQPVSSLPDSAALVHKSSTDGKSSGTISTSKYNIANDEYSGDSYDYGGAAFANTDFTVTEKMVENQTGYLVIAVTNASSEAGDNECQSDDTLYIRYIIGDNPDHDMEIGGEATGDLNLGMPEYRSLHYLTEEEVEKEDKGDGSGSDSGDTGDTGEPEEPEKKTYEVSSDYGYYQSSSQANGNLQGKKENDTPKNPNDNDIWKADEVGDSVGDPWWEYTERQWPDQSEDLENKCWLTDASGTWNQDGEFMRSFSGENQFGFGFRVSRSRGKENSTLNAAYVNVQIYGVSPDTGDDGVLLSEKTVNTGALGVYSYGDAFLSGIVSSKAINGIEDFPRIRVAAQISDKHGESGYFNNVFKAPAENSWEDAHDTVDRTFECEMDDMRIVEVEIKDSEGIVIYHADRYNSSAMEEAVKGYYDREEDLYMKVVVEQNLESGHSVKNPAIDVMIVGTNEDGMPEKTYINTTYTLEGTEMGQGVTATFDQIAFRPKSAEKLRINVQINDKHGADEWRENIWDDDDDAYGVTIDSTTADLALSQNIEAYNSKNNEQGYLTFAEYLSFKFDIRHIGNSDRQTMVVGGSEINPNAKVNVKIYNADALTLNPQNYNLLYRMASQDPKAASALIMTGDIQAQSRLYPGLGSNGFAAHVQAWFKNYIVQSYETGTGNMAAYGHILVSGTIDESHDANHTNVRDNTVDYVQKEFFGEKNLKISDIGVTAKNAISGDTGISVQVAISDTASSYNDQTVVDKTYLDIYVDDELKKTTEVEIPVGDTIVTEVSIEDVDLNTCKVVEARVNTGQHQTHYEYVLRKTDASLFPDPFRDNYKSIVVCANKPSVTVCPVCDLSENIQVDSIFADDTPSGGYTPVVDNSKFKIIFNINDGSTVNTVQSVGFNSTAILVGNTFTRQGYTFAGWNTAEDGSGSAYADKAIYTVGSKQSYGGSTTLNLYAQWDAVTYTMKFDANGGRGSMDPITMKFDEAKFLPANTFTKTGYIFAGWNTRADGSGISVENGGSVMNFTTTANSTVTLYAQWITEADCEVMENFSASEAVGLQPGAQVAENPSLISYVDYTTYGYIRVKIPTISACKAGDNGVEKVYDLFTPNWNTAHWTKVKEEVSTVAGVPSVYIWRYNTVLDTVNTTATSTIDGTRMANRSSDLYSKVTVGDFVSASNLKAETELVGIVYQSASGSVGNIGNLGITDQIVITMYDKYDQEMEEAGN